MVISHKISEKIMDNRGSKSKVSNTIVKEQRIDGNLPRIQILRKRYILKSFERNYQVGIPSNQINTYKFYFFISIWRFIFLHARPCYEEGGCRVHLIGRRMKQYNEQDQHRKSYYEGECDVRSVVLDSNANKYCKIQLAWVATPSPNFVGTTLRKIN